MKTYDQLIDNYCISVGTNCDDIKWVSKDVVKSILAEHDKEMLDALREREQLIINHLDSGLVGDRNYFEGKMTLIVDIIKFIERGF